MKVSEILKKVKDKFMSIQDAGGLEEFGRTEKKRMIGEIRDLLESESLEVYEDNNNELFTWDGDSDGVTLIISLYALVQDKNDERFYPIHDMEQILISANTHYHEDFMDYLESIQFYKDDFDMAIELFEIMEHEEEKKQANKNDGVTTVGELIKQLQEFDPNKEIRVGSKQIKHIANKAEYYSFVRKNS